MNNNTSISPDSLDYNSRWIAFRQYCSSIERNPTAQVFIISEIVTQKLVQWSSLVRTGRSEEARQLRETINPDIISGQRILSELAKQDQYLQVFRSGQRENRTYPFEHFLIFGQTGESFIEQMLRRAIALDVTNERAYGLIQRLSQNTAPSMANARSLALEIAQLLPNDKQMALITSIPQLPDPGPVIRATNATAQNTANLIEFEFPDLPSQELIRGSRQTDIQTNFYRAGAVYYHFVQSFQSASDATLPPPSVSQLRTSIDEQIHDYGLGGTAFEIPLTLSIIESYSYSIARPHPRYNPSHMAEPMNEQMMGHMDEELIIPRTDLIALLDWIRELETRGDSKSRDYGHTIEERISRYLNPTEPIRTGQTLVERRPR